MRSAELRNLYETHGKKVLYICRDLLEGKKLPNGATYKLKPEDFGLRAMWEALVGPCEDTLPSSGKQDPFFYLEEQVNSTMFTALSQLVLANKVIEAYEAQPGIGDQLVTVMNSDRRLENIAGFGDLEGLEPVLEGELYKDSSLVGRYVTSEASKRGRLLSITDEAIREDRTGQLLLTAGKWGEMAANDREMTIIAGVTDVNGNVYRPSGAAQALFSVANLNLIGNALTPGGAPFNAAMPLSSWTDLADVQRYHAATIRTIPSKGPGRPIVWAPTTLLVPPALEQTALTIMNATEIRDLVGASSIRVFRNPVANKYAVLSSPFLTASASTWWMGDFKKEFVWHEVIPVQVTRQDASGPEAFERDVIARFKVRYFAGVAALDTPYVMQILGA